jgi:hypothetical protein
VRALYNVVLTTKYTGTPGKRAIKQGMKMAQQMFKNAGLRVAIHPEVLDSVDTTPASVKFADQGGFDRIALIDSESIRIQGGYKGGSSKEGGPLNLHPGIARDNPRTAHYEPTFIVANMIAHESGHSFGLPDVSATDSASVMRSPRTWGEWGKEQYNYTASEIQELSPYLN